jgi:hypothetical protein
VSWWTLEEKVLFYIAKVIWVLVAAWWGYYLCTKFRNVKWYWWLFLVPLFVFSCSMFLYYASLFYWLDGEISNFAVMRSLNSLSIFLLWQAMLLSYVIIWLIVISGLNKFINRKNSVHVDSR